MSVLVRNLGRLSYHRGLQIQKEFVQIYKDKEQTEVGVVLLCEHTPPTYTIGLRDNITKEQIETLEGLGADVVKTRRGGLVTFHGLGQLVCYPVINLHRLRLGVHQYIQCLEQSVIRTSLQYGIESHTTEHTGVWIGNEKLCAIGIQVSMGVTHHGLALNCNTDLSWFNYIVPCGIMEKGVTSLSKHLNRNVTVDQVSPVMMKCLSDQLGLTIV